MLQGCPALHTSAGDDTDTESATRTSNTSETTATYSVWDIERVYVPGARLDVADALELRGAQMGGYNDHEQAQRQREPRGRHK